MERETRRDRKPVQAYSVLQVHFLARLRDMKARLNVLEPTTTQPWVQRALQRAVYATLRDCIEAGVGDDARAILQRDGTGARYP